MANKTETAYFAGGCFWGVETLFEDFAGVIATSVGFMGGNVDNPTYRQISSSRTGHAEVLKIEFDPKISTYEELAKHFFEIHDPTQLNAQGPDKGNQYRSVVFYTDKRQKDTAEKLINVLKDKGIDVVTEVVEASTFWPAEEYHQKYHTKQGDQPYCHIYTKRF